MRLVLGVARGIPEASLKARQWDASFIRWINAAKADGGDPNDVGDVEWSNDDMDYALDEHYLPHIDSESVVLELGPGTGRLTRKLIAKCREMILVDHSKLVCNWLETYLEGKGNFRIYHVETPKLSMIENDSVSVVLAHGVVEHLDLHDLSWYFDEFFRVLKPGGVMAFNYDNISSDEGVEWLIEKRYGPGDNCVFRFYTPEVLTRVATRSGFDVFRMTSPASRLGYAELIKPKN
jgi:SAM-dependent methyltransferase